MNLNDAERIHQHRTQLANLAQAHGFIAKKPHADMGWIWLERQASIDKVNADLLTVKMLRAHSERQASTQRASFHKGTEAPV